MYGSSGLPLGSAEGKRTHIFITAATIFSVIVLALANVQMLTPSEHDGHATGDSFGRVLYDAHYARLCRFLSSRVDVGASLLPECSSVMPYF